jgi:hypothetical protein
MSLAVTVTIPNVELSFDQLVSAVRQLGPEARTELAKALLETELDEQLDDLLHSLAHRSPADDITDADIVAEVNAVRGLEQHSC